MKNESQKPQNETVATAKNITSIPEEYLTACKEVNKAHKELSKQSITQYTIIKAYLTVNKKFLEEAKAEILAQTETALAHEDEKANIDFVKSTAEIAFKAFDFGLKIVTTHTTFENIKQLVGLIDSTLTATTATEKAPASLLFFSATKDGKPEKVNFAHFADAVQTMMLNVIDDTKTELGFADGQKFLEVSTKNDYKNERKVYSNRLRNGIKKLKSQYSTDLEDSEKIKGTLGNIFALSEIATISLQDLEDMAKALKLVHTKIAARNKADDEIDAELVEPETAELEKKVSA